MSKVKSLLIKYGACAVFVALMVWGIVSSRDFSKGGLETFYRYWSDAFFIPGILLILSGLLVFVANEGSFNAIGYLMRSVVTKLVPGDRMKPETYGEYVERKREKKVTGYSFLFISGLVSIAISTVFLVLYYQL